MAERAVTECIAVANESSNYQICRLSTVKTLQTGKASKIHIVVRRHIDEEEVLRQEQKAWRGRGNAHIALCYQALRGQGKMTKQSLESARSHRKDATMSESTSTPG